MDKNKTAIESFLGELGETKNPFEENQEDPFDQATAEPNEEVVEEPEAKEEKPLPFNKDPKIQKYIEKEISKKLSEYEVKTEEPVKSQADDDDYYERLIGNDTPEKLAMIREAKARDEYLLQQAEERAFNRLSAKEQEELRADQEAEQELENAFENIEETFGVDITSNTAIAKKTRQEFVSFVEKIAPKQYGEIVAFPDMQSAWETFSEMKKTTGTTSRAKDLASRSMARSSGTEVKADTKGLGFDNILEHLQQ